MCEITGNKEVDILRKVRCRLFLNYIRTNSKLERFLTIRTFACIIDDVIGKKLKKCIGFKPLPHNMQRVMRDIF